MTINYVTYHATVGVLWLVVDPLFNATIFEPYKFIFNISSSIFFQKHPLLLEDLVALKHTSQFSSCVKKTPMVNVDYIVSPFYNCPISFCKCCTVSWDKSKVKRMTSSSFKKSIWPYQIIKSIGSYIWQSV